jgi:6-phosphogluconolactonase
VRKEIGVRFTAFADRPSASRAAAERLAAGLRDDLDRRGAASLVLSGGTTPGPCFDLLSHVDLDWRHVHVMPSDERWVPPGDPNSNERLIRERLLRNAAAGAGFIPLYRDGLEPDAAPAAVEHDLATLGARFSGVLLGMGADGHFASLFPDFAGLPDALDPASTARCVVVRTAGSPFLRISLTLAALLHAREITLLFFGADKRAVFEVAEAGDSGLPVSALLAQTAVPLTALWAP